MESIIDKLKCRAEKFIDLAMNLNNCYVIYDQIRKYIYEENEFINLSPSFFRVISRALILEIYVESAKIYDSDKNNDSILHLLNDSEKNITCFTKNKFSSVHFTSISDRKGTVINYDSPSDMIFKNKILVESDREIFQSIRKQRNKFYAHNDKMIIHNPKDLFKKYSVNMIEFETILIHNTNICNDFMNLFFDKTVYPIVIDCTDLSSILDNIKKGNYICDTTLRGIN